MTEVPQAAAYLNSAEQFIEHRLAYYANTDEISLTDVYEKIFPDSYRRNPEGMYFLAERDLATEKLRLSTSPITIVTATNNRPESLKVAYDVLNQQKGSIDWNWLIVDNVGDEATKKVIADFNDSRVIHVHYLEETGCAFPVRNFGLDLIHYAKYNQGSEPGYVIVIDSDDRLYNEYSLSELFHIANSSIAKQKGILLAHGFADSEIYQTDGSITHVPNPRNWDSHFPEIHSLKEVFDKGLNILSGMFPTELVRWLRYPPERSFEDDGLNQKLMLQAKKQHMVWVADSVPITVKKFHQESMSAINNNIGDVSLNAKVGEHFVTGVRAQIIFYLQNLTDYYTREEL